MEQVVLGSQEFLVKLRPLLRGDEREQRGVQRLQTVRPDLASVIRCVEEVKGQKWEEFRDRHGDSGRDLVLYLGRRACGSRLAELATLVGAKEYATVAMAVKRLARRLQREARLREECRQVHQLLNVKI
jgi:hypothetical protein